MIWRPFAILWRLVARFLCPDRALRRPTVDDRLRGDR